MTGFRIARGGAQELYGVTPDLTCLGKIVGGGLPCAVFGGRADVMNLLAPLGPVYQAGTLSGNPLAMAAGIATLDYLYDHSDEIYPGLDSLSGALVDGILVAGRQSGLEMCASRVGSMFTWFFWAGPVTDFQSAAASNTAEFARFHRAMLERGYWFPPSQFEAAFLSAAHTDHDVAETITAAADVFAAATPSP